MVSAGARKLLHQPAVAWTKMVEGFGDVREGFRWLLSL